MANTTEIEKKILAKCYEGILENNVFFSADVPSSDIRIRNMYVHGHTQQSRRLREYITSIYMYKSYIYCGYK